MRKLIKLGCYDRRVDFENGPERKLANVPNSGSEQEIKFLEFEEIKKDELLIPEKPVLPKKGSLKDAPSFKVIVIGDR